MYEGTLAACLWQGDSPPASQAEEQAKWDQKQDKAVGELFLHCSADQRLHFEDVQDDPIKIWTTLESTHVQQLPATCFNAWNDFFTIRKRPDESLSTLIARIEEGMAKIQRLRPQDSSKPYSRLSDLDAELVSMAMIRALGENYAQFASSLILLKSLDQKELKAAFLAEETQHHQRADALGVSSSDSALFSAPGAPPSSCKCGANAICDFCEKAGHCVHKCFAMQRAREVHKTRQAPNQSGKSGKRPRNANKASEATQCGIVRQHTVRARP
ncbi:uncharacterized protein HD556DRAFT_1434386 [Suillus plorans]|uniref:Uncharacterized protein n=1 Tax=Suillus plorans TaxID=116603 RepID=A0A9P7DD59_9AGAM|nr:uncharacterized protein HD556DRAFT_1434386 [Suillus plorans]KAG1787608.1 hypothetical protein HD556DRAFT_1434386 [Suillus plorans]